MIIKRNPKAQPFELEKQVFFVGDRVVTDCLNRFPELHGQNGVVKEAYQVRNRLRDELVWVYIVQLRRRVQGFYIGELHSNGR